MMKDVYTNKASYKIYVNYHYLVHKGTFQYSNNGAGVILALVNHNWCVGETFQYIINGWRGIIVWP